jgi:hypothetical protein
VPGIRPVTIVVVPLPAIDPGLIVHTPVAGRPLRATLPVGEAHDEGCVIAPTIGMEGIPGGGRMTTLADGSDVQPDPTDTVKLYVPVARFVMLAMLPDPVIAPGLIVQVPVAGSPFNTTLPVGESHEEGWVIVPIAGAEGASTVRLATFEVALLAPLQLVI